MNNKDLPYRHTELYSTFCNNLCGKRIQERIDICTCVTESRYCTHESNTMLFINLLQYKIQLFKTARLSSAWEKRGRQRGWRPGRWRGLGENQRELPYTLTKSLLAGSHWGMGTSVLQPQGTQFSQQPQWMSLKACSSLEPLKRNIGLPMIWFQPEILGRGR